MATTEIDLAATLTTLVESTPGVTGLYLPTRVIPGRDTGRRVLTGLHLPVPAAHVVVDEARQAVSASIGIDMSAPASAIGEAVCARIRRQLALTGHDMSIKVTIAYTTG
ncbi:hypothetical protein [Frondihabitans sp. VKM Ac-2883]|uniref:hypothetical protein n=1 Tax=Frondihabitans sp. VKM Ac-2883 TaxID=2783823 RepID=UPI001889F805|nr:hypothetical protein [Frondihabitans sp. VKM Ac-2883]MBF4575300.1 hypothetical protein [Frondihabitans sp. VKM Ac-2883]